MKQKKKKSSKGLLVGGGAIVIAAILFFSGQFNFLTGQTNPANDTTTLADGQSAVQAEVVLEIKGNQLLYNGQVLAVDAIATTFGSGERVVIKTADAKQLFYDEVVAELTKAGCVIIEE